MSLLERLFSAVAPGRISLSAMLAPGLIQDHLDARIQALKRRPIDELDFLLLLSPGRDLFFLPGIGFNRRRRWRFALLLRHFFTVKLRCTRRVRFFFFL